MYLPGIKISDVTALRAAGLETAAIARRATEAYLMQVRVPGLQGFRALRFVLSSRWFLWSRARGSWTLHAGYLQQNSLMTCGCSPASQVLQHSFLHSDPHPGNIAVAADGAPTLAHTPLFQACFYGCGRAA